jgi:hypothetical protein
MATNYLEIQEYLKNMGVQSTYHPEEDYFWIGFGTEEYTDPEGKKHLRLIIQLLEDGGLVEVLMPTLYRYKGPHLDAMILALLKAQRQTILGRYIYFPADGEVRFSISYALEDGDLTETMLFRLIDASHWAAEKFAPVFRRVIETGKVEFDVESYQPCEKTMGEGARALN